MHYPLLDLLNTRENITDSKGWLHQHIGAMMFTGGRTQVKFKFRLGYDETWCEIKQTGVDRYYLEVYSIQGQSSRWKFDPRSPGGMAPPSRGVRKIIIQRSGLTSEEVPEVFERYTRIIL